MRLGDPLIRRFVGEFTFARLSDGFRGEPDNEQPPRAITGRPLIVSRYLDSDQRLVSVYLIRMSPEPVRTRRSDPPPRT